MSEFSHLNREGEARMVDITGKEVVFREAIAAGEIRLQAATLERIEGNQVAKGNVLAIARIAGIQAAKRTSDLIPLCHPIALTHCDLEFEVPEGRDRIRITARTQCSGKTGVEMEALTAVSVAALTIYDMCKAVDKTMEILGIHLIHKEKKKL